MTETPGSGGVWTHFWDMRSGGGLKEKWQHIFIEAPEAEAKVVFYNRFGHNPERVSCTCCGGDYSISEGPIDQLTAYHRNCRFLRVASEDGGGHYVEEPDPERSYGGSYVPLADFLKSKEVHVVRAKEIKASERKGTVPDQGYVWVD